MLGADRELVVIRLEHPAHEAGRHALGRDHDKRAGARELLLDPTRHRDVGQSHDVVAVHVRQEQRGKRMRRCPRLHQPHDRGAAGVELQRDFAVAHQHAGTGAARPRMRHSRPGENHFGRHAWNPVFVGVIVTGRDHTHRFRIVPMPSIHVSST